MYVHRSVTRWTCKCACTEQSHTGTHKCTRTELSRRDSQIYVHPGSPSARNEHMIQAYTESNNWMIQHDWLETTGLRKEPVIASFKVLPQRLQRGAEEKDEKPQSGKQISEMKLEHRTYELNSKHLTSKFGFSESTTSPRISNTKHGSSVLKFISYSKILVYIILYKL